MRERELKKYWITLIYGNRLSNPPKALPSSEIIQKVVQANKNAIAVIHQSDFDEQVKPLKIDGISYKGSDYYLKE